MYLHSPDMLKSEERKTSPLAEKIKLKHMGGMEQ